MIELKGISIGYGAQVLVTGANAVFPQSSLTSLIGRNGAGKSTLLRAIAGIGKIMDGEIIVDEKSRFESAIERAKSIAFVSTQRVKIANMRCRDLVGLGRAPYTDWVGRLSKSDNDIVATSLELVGMKEYADRTFDTMSDGECQRIMIARALAQDTPNILLDEPTSFLDLPNRYQLMELLGDLAHNHGKTILLSTHELDIALSKGDNIALIDTPELKLLPTSEAHTRNVVATAFGIDNLF